MFQWQIASQKLLHHQQRRSLDVILFQHKVASLNKLFSAPSLLNVNRVHLITPPERRKSISVAKKRRFCTWTATVAEEIAIRFIAQQRPGRAIVFRWFSPFTSVIIRSLANNGKFPCPKSVSEHRGKVLGAGKVEIDTRTMMYRLMKAKRTENSFTSWTISQPILILVCLPSALSMIIKCCLESIKGRVDFFRRRCQSQVSLFGFNRIRLQIKSLPTLSWTLWRPSNRLSQSLSVSRKAANQIREYKSHGNIVRLNGFSITNGSFVRRSEILFLWCLC